MTKPPGIIGGMFALGSGASMTGDPSVANPFAQQQPDPTDQTANYNTPLNPLERAEIAEAALREERWHHEQTAEGLKDCIAILFEKLKAAQLSSDLETIPKMDVSEFRKLVANPPLPLMVTRYGKPKFLVIAPTLPTAEAQS